MAKVTPVLWKHKTNAEGHSPIYLRIYAGGKTKYKSLSVHVHQRHWNEGQRRVRKSHRRHAQINTRITERLAEAEGAVLDRQREGKPVRPRHVKRALAETDGADSAAAGEDFLAYGEKVAKRLQRNEQIGTARLYRAVLRKMRDAFGKRTLSFEEITPQLLRDYEAYCIETRGNARTTTAKNLSIIRAILYRAIKDGHARQEDNPFFHFTIRKGTPERDTLTLAQLRKIEREDLEEGSRLWHARAYFLFALYAAGVRFRDLALLERRNVTQEASGWRVAYHMSKTGAPRNVQLVPPAQKIVRRFMEGRRGLDEPWLFPMLDGQNVSTPDAKHDAVNRENRRYNAALQRVAERAGIDCHLTFHVARHSFASVAQRKGWDVAEISQALGHSSLKVTEQYLKGFDDTDLDDKMSDLFSSDGGEG